jgi:hypothetical protein
VDISEVSGTRMSWRPSHYKSGYVHSHCNSDVGSHYALREGEKGFYHFCLGASDFKASISLLSTAPFLEDPELFKEYFLLVLFQLETYISYESLEGGPYRRISEISELGTIKQPPNTSHIEITYELLKAEIIRRRSLNREIPGIDWNYSNGKFTIVDNERFEDFFLTLLRGSSWIGEVDANGNQYHRSSLDENVYEQPWAYLNFRDRVIITTVEKEVDNGTVKQYIHPQIKNYVKLQLESIATSSQIRACGFSRIDSYRNSRLRIRQDQIFM